MHLIKWCIMFTMNTNLQEWIFQQNVNNVHGTESLTLQPMLVRLKVISSVLFEKKIYIMGVFTTDAPKSRQVQVYSLKVREWSTLPEAPVYNAAIVVVNDHITLLGGRDAKTDEPTNILCVWFENAGQWQSNILPRMPTVRVMLGVHYHGNLLLVTGGAEKNADFEGQETLTAVNRVDVYNVLTKQWTTPLALQLPKALRSHFLVFLEEHIYLTGGATKIFDSPAEIGSSDSFSSNSWRIKWTDLEEAVTHPAAMPEKQLWTPIANLPALCSTVVSGENSIISVGGVKGSLPLDVIYRYAEEKNDWIEVGHMDIGRYRHAVVPLGSHGATLFVAGGFVWSPIDECNEKSTSVELVVL